jgi:RNA polymerase sigma factor (sigma-70 family)
MTACFSCARDGDPVAKSDVVDSLRPRITKMASYYARCSGEDPDDLLQEAWCALLEALPTLDMNIGTPDQFLIQRARWRMLDAIKRARIRRCLPIEVAEMVPVSSPYPDKFVGDTTVAQFASNLKTTQKDVLRCLMTGLTWRETGDALGCTSANVAYHVKQIRRQYEAWNE